MTWEPNSRFVQRRWRCEGCDQPVAPNEIVNNRREGLCEECSRAELDKEMEDEGT